MPADAALLDPSPEAGQEEVVDRIEDAPLAFAAPRARREPSLCSRFAWGAAGIGGALFVAGLVEAAGTWALSAGSVSVTVASIAGVIAMEGSEVQPPRAASRPARPRARTP